ncbi:MAG: hypothetical protein LUC88_03635, partial [Prevotella sp.]|nr:hypothetical protein [Prevotella sp.]
VSSEWKKDGILLTPIDAGEFAGWYAQSCQTYGLPQKYSPATEHLFEKAYEQFSKKGLTLCPTDPDKLFDQGEEMLINKFCDYQQNLAQYVPYRNFNGLNSFTDAIDAAYKDFELTDAAVYAYFIGTHRYNAFGKHDPQGKMYDYTPPSQRPALLPKFNGLEFGESSTTGFFPCDVAELTFDDEGRLDTAYPIDKKRHYASFFGGHLLDFILKRALRSLTERTSHYTQPLPIRTLLSSDSATPIRSVLPIFTS